MDTSSSTAKKSIRASLTAQYEARVASTLEKVDPNQAKARAVLQDESMEIEALEGEWDGYKDHPLPQEPQGYEGAPTLTLPGTTGGDDDDRELDLSFRADRIEFIVVQRKLSPPEVEADTVLKGPADVYWSILD